MTAQTKYPPSQGTARPFRLWDASAKQTMRWRYYKDPRRAHMGALIECRWTQPGRTIELYDARNGRLMGQYTRRVSAIEFAGTEYRPRPVADPGEA